MLVCHVFLLCNNKNSFLYLAVESCPKSASVVNKNESMLVRCKILVPLEVLNSRGPVSELSPMRERQTWAVVPAPNLLPVQSVNLNININNKNYNKLIFRDYGTRALVIPQPHNKTKYIIRLMILKNNCLLRNISELIALASRFYIV